MPCYSFYSLFSDHWDKMIFEVIFFFQFWYIAWEGTYIKHVYFRKHFFFFSIEIWLSLVNLIAKVFFFGAFTQVTLYIFSFEYDVFCFIFIKPIWTNLSTMSRDLNIPGR